MGGRVNTWDVPRVGPFQGRLLGAPGGPRGLLRSTGFGGWLLKRTCAGECGGRRKRRRIEGGRRPVESKGVKLRRCRGWVGGWVGGRTVVTVGRSRRRHRGRRRRRKGAVTVRCCWCWPWTSLLRSLGIVAARGALLFVSLSLCVWCCVGGVVWVGGWVCPNASSSSTSFPSMQASHRQRPAHPCTRH